MVGCKFIDHVAQYSCIRNNLEYTVSIMKSVVVTSSLPDIVYFWGDDEFISHLNRVFLKDQVISQDDDLTTVDLNVALQYFSPLVLSQRCMNRENCGYKSITLGNGMIIVIDQVSNSVDLSSQSRGGGGAHCRVDQSRATLK